MRPPNTNVDRSGGLFDMVVVRVYDLAQKFLYTRERSSRTTKILRYLPDSEVDDIHLFELKSPEVRTSRTR